MKKIYSLFIMCVLVFNAALNGAKDTQELFLRAQDAYQRGLYTQALQELEQITADTAALSYVKGNCFYQIGDYPRALGFWQKALKSAPVSLFPSLLANRAQVAKKLSLDQWSDFYKARLYFYAYFGVFWIQLLSLIAVWLLGLLIVFKSLKFLYTVVLSLVCLFTLAGCLSCYDLFYVPRVVILQEQSLRTGPDIEFPAFAQVSAASCVRVVERQDSWYKISYRSYYGWVPNSSSMIIS